MHLRRTTTFNTFALIAGILAMCFGMQARAEDNELARNAEPPAKTGTLLFGSHGNLWVINSDGSGLKQVSNFKGNDVYFSASWSPEGSKIAYLNYRRLEGSPLTSLNIWVMNADGSSVTPLTGDPSRVFEEFAWSPNGRKFAAVSQLVELDKSKGLNYLSKDILVVNADGSGTKPLLQFMNPGIYHENLLWSPDGGKIAFVSNSPLDGRDDHKDHGINRNIWVMNADGSHAVPLTRFTGTSVNMWEMAWSHDSQTLAYLSNRALDGSDAAGARNNIWVVNVDGSGSRPLTRFMHALCRSFTWSPDESRMSFSSNASLDGSDVQIGPFNLWIMKADGSALRPLTTGTVFESRNDTPVWSPDGSMIGFVSCIDSSSAKPRPSPYCNLWIMKDDGSGARPLTDLNDVQIFNWRP